MAISYPLAFPATGGELRVVLRGHDVVGMQGSPITMEQTVYDWGGDILEADVEAIPMRRADAEVWVAFQLSLRGRLGTFLMGDTLNTRPRGTWAGTPVVSGAHAAGVRTVALDGLTAGATGLVGDWLQFGTGATSRLHKLLQDFTANGSGQANAELWPRTRYALLDNAAIVTSSPKGLWRLASNSREWSLGVAQIYGIRFSCVEALDA